MELTKVEPAAGLDTAVLFAGTAGVEDVAPLVQDPREALTRAGVDVPADRDIAVRVDRSGARIAPREADDEEGGGDEEGRADGTVVVVVIDTGSTTVVIVLVPSN